MRYNIDVAETGISLEFNGTKRQNEELACMIHSWFHKEILVIGTDLWDEEPVVDREINPDE